MPNDDAEHATLTDFVDLDDERSTLTDFGEFATSICQAKVFDVVCAMKLIALTPASRAGLRVVVIDGLRAMFSPERFRSLGDVETKVDFAITDSGLLVEKRR